MLEITTNTGSVITTIAMMVMIIIFMVAQRSREEISHRFKQRQMSKRRLELAASLTSHPLQASRMGSGSRFSPLE
jgi:hypothetical protein